MNRERTLKIVLVLVGLIFLFGVYPLMMFLWPAISLIDGILSVIRILR